TDDHSEIYALSLHDALPISGLSVGARVAAISRARDGAAIEAPLVAQRGRAGGSDGEGRIAALIDGLALRLGGDGRGRVHRQDRRSEEHTSELQSRFDLVCRL